MESRQHDHVSVGILVAVADLYPVAAYRRKSSVMKSVRFNVLAVGAGASPGAVGEPRLAIAGPDLRRETADVLITASDARRANKTQPRHRTGAGGYRRPRHPSCPILPSTRLSRTASAAGNRMCAKAHHREIIHSNERRVPIP
jgi:hypothetical protein